MNTAVDNDDGNPLLKQRARRALKEWREQIVRIVQSGIRRGEIRANRDAKALATLVIATLEGAVMLGRLEKSEEPLRTVQAHLLRKLEEYRN